MARKKVSLAEMEVGDKLRVYTMFTEKEMIVGRITPKYVATECGNKYRISDGKVAGSSWGLRAEPWDLKEKEEAEAKE